MTQTNAIFGKVVTNQILKEESGIHRSDRQICLISNSAPEGTDFAPLVHLTRKSFINDHKQQVEKTSKLVQTGRVSYAFA